jgi:hypothetical protein
MLLLIILHIGISFILILTVYRKILSRIGVNVGEMLVGMIELINILFTQLGTLGNYKHYRYFHTLHSSPLYTP